MSHPDPEEIRKAAIEVDPEFAKAVARWEIEVGEDWRGEPAVFVVIVLRDADVARVWRTRDAFRRRLRERLFELLPEEYYPFITFSAESESLDPRAAAIA